MQLGKIVGGIDLGQHQELSFGHVKFEVPPQSSKQKGQGAESSSVREVKAISIYSPERRWDHHGRESRRKRREPGAAAALGGGEMRWVPQRLNGPEEWALRRELGYSSRQGSRAFQGGRSGQPWECCQHVRCELELTAGFSREEDESVSAKGERQEPEQNGLEGEWKEMNRGGGCADSLCRNCRVRRGQGSLGFIFPRREITVSLSASIMKVLRSSEMTHRFVVLNTITPSPVCVGREGGQCFPLGGFRGVVFCRVCVCTRACVQRWAGVGLTVAFVIVTKFGFISSPSGSAFTS